MFLRLSLCLSLSLFALACRGPKPSPSNTSTDSVLPLTPDPFSSLVELETAFGSMKIELFFHAEKHRENFLKLAQGQFYDSLLFHRVIKGFMVQGGDPQSKNAPLERRIGGGDNGYLLDSEINTRYFHVKGALAAARQPDEVNPNKKSSGCQFYIVHGSPVTDEQLDRIERKYGFAYTSTQRRLYKALGGAPQLDMEYTVFGRVYEGLEVLDKLANSPTDAQDRPQVNLMMKVKILR